MLFFSVIKQINQSKSWKSSAVVMKLSKRRVFTLVVFLNRFNVHINKENSNRNIIKYSMQKKFILVLTTSGYYTPPSISIPSKPSHSCTRTKTHPKTHFGPPPEELSETAPGFHAFSFLLQPIT